MIPYDQLVRLELSRGFYHDDHGDGWNTAASKIQVSGDYSKIGRKCALIYKL